MGQWKGSFKTADLNPLHAKSLTVDSREYPPAVIHLLPQSLRSTGSTTVLWRIYPGANLHYICSIIVVPVACVLSPGPTQRPNQQVPSSNSPFPASRRVDLVNFGPSRARTPNPIPRGITQEPSALMALIMQGSRPCGGTNRLPQ